MSIFERIISFFKSLFGGASPTLPELDDNQGYKNSSTTSSSTAHRDDEVAATSVEAPTQQSVSDEVEDESKREQAVPSGDAEAPATPDEEVVEEVLTKEDKEPKQQVKSEAKARKQRERKQKKANVGVNIFQNELLKAIQLHTQKDFNNAEILYKNIVSKDIIKKILNLLMPIDISMPISFLLSSIAINIVLTIPNERPDRIIIINIYNTAASISLAYARSLDISSHPSIKLLEFLDIKSFFT